MADEPKVLIPSPPAVRAKLAKNLEEGKLLRAQLRVSLRAYELEQRNRPEARVAEIATVGA